MSILWLLHYNNDDIAIDLIFLPQRDFMNKIQQLLQPHNIEVNEEEIAKLCAEVGADIEQLTDSEAQTIAQHILEQRQQSSLKLAPTNGKSKNGNGKITKGTRRKPVPPLEGAIAHASRVSNQEIQSLSEILEEGIDLYTNDQADRLLASVRNAPKEVVRKFTERAMEEEADVENFRDIGQQLVAGIFGVSLTNAAE
jgi:uncharacterized protein YaaQ